MESCINSCCTQPRLLPGRSSAADYTNAMALRRGTSGRKAPLLSRLYKTEGVVMGSYNSVCRRSARY